MKPTSIDGRNEAGGMKTPCFTLQYAAPEVLDQAPIINTIVDNGSCAGDHSSAPGLVPSNSLTTSEKSKDGYNESCDLWSLGVILVIFLSYMQLPEAFTDVLQDGGLNFP